MPAIINQQILSDEVQEIISYKPSWVIRKGNIIFLLVLAALLGLGFIIRYPDIVRATVRIAVINAPKMLITKTEGHLEKIFVTNGQQVSKGQSLAYIKSTADYNQVIQLQQWIIATAPFSDAGNIDILAAYPLPTLNELGSLQPAYQNFQNTMLETMQVLASGYYQKKKNSLERDIQFQHLLKQNLDSQANLQQKDYMLQKIEHDANEKLATEKVIAPLEFNREKSKLLNKEQQLQQMTSQLINSNVAENSKNKELLDLQKYVTDQKQKYRSELLKLKSSLEEWAQQYVIISPEEGKLEFTSFLQENQLVSNGQELFFVQPSGSKYYGEMKAGQNNLGKIKTGQKVLLRLESYPSAEFGYINGTISFISNKPNDRDSFLIKVELPDGLKTNYNKAVFFRNGLSASAEIITEDKHLIEKLFGQLRTFIKN